VIVDVAGGFAIGWIESTSLIVPNVHITRSPNFRPGVSEVRSLCRHPIDLFAIIDAQIVHIATVPAGVPFDFNAPRPELLRMGVDVTAPFTHIKPC
jgi:hypothetical protein